VTSGARKAGKSAIFLNWAGKAGKPILFWLEKLEFQLLKY